MFYSMYHLQKRKENTEILSYMCMCVCVYVMFVPKLKYNHDLYGIHTLVVETFMMGIAVKAIKRQHLVEIRSMANPPAIVKLAVESICLLLEENTTDWKQIRAVIMKDSFIPTIVNFNTEDIT